MIFIHYYTHTFFLICIYVKHVLLSVAVQSRSGIRIQNHRYMSFLSLLLWRITLKEIVPHPSTRREPCTSGYTQELHRISKSTNYLHYYKVMFCSPIVGAWFFRHISHYIISSNENIFKKKWFQSKII